MNPILASAIAWLPTETSKVSSLLRTKGAVGIEAAPRLFSCPLSEVNLHQVSDIRSFWEGEGLPILAMQALLFGRPELRLFGTDEERQALAEYLRLVFRLASGLGARHLVFGSPKNRIRGDMEPALAFDVAERFFRKIAKDAEAVGCVLCIEANATGYGCDFVTTHEEAATLVKAVASPGFGLQIDTGVMQMNAESPSELASILCAKEILPSHVHISEPFLAPVDATTPFHHELYAVLKDMRYTGAVSVEMKRPSTVSSLSNAVVTAWATYGESRHG